MSRAEGKRIGAGTSGGVVEPWLAAIFRGDGQRPNIPPTIIFLPWRWSFGMKRCTKTTLNTSWAVVEPSKTQWKEHGLKNSEQQEICFVRKDQRNSRSYFYFGTKNFSKANPELPEMRRRGVKPRRGMAPQHFAKLLSRCWCLRHCGLDSSLCFHPAL